MDEIWVYQDWEYRGFFTSDSILKITVIFSIIFYTCEIRHHANSDTCREESELGLFQILIWLKGGSSMKKKTRIIKAAIGIRCISCFVGPPPTFLASPATLNLFDNPGHNKQIQDLFYQIKLECITPFLNVQQHTYHIYS